MRITIFKFSILIALVCNTLVLSSIARADESDFENKVPLTGDEVKAKLIGNTVTGFSVDSGVSFTVFYPAYGKILGEAGPWGMFTDEGVWVIRDKLYCVTWESWSSEELCFSVYIDGDAISWVKPGGELLSTDTLIPGNPADL